MFVHDRIQDDSIMYACILLSFWVNCRVLVKITKLIAEINFYFSPIIENQ
jgi:hypothetical protein